MPREEDITEEMMEDFIRRRVDINQEIHNARAKVAEAHEMISRNIRGDEPITWNVPNENFQEEVNKRDQEAHKARLAQSAIETQVFKQSQLNENIKTIIDILTNVKLLTSEAQRQSIVDLAHIRLKEHLDGLARIK